jgi:hypothetical protein
MWDSLTFLESDLVGLVGIFFGVVVMIRRMAKIKKDEGSVTDETRKIILTSMLSMSRSY